MIGFDTETTGFLKSINVDLTDQPDIIEIGAIKIDDKTLEEVDRLSLLFKIKQPIPEEVVDVTGITDEDLKDQKTFAQCYEEIYNFFLGETIWIGHNVMFDFNIMKYSLTKIDKEHAFPYPKKLICTVEESKFIKGKRLKLGHLYELATEEPIKGWHRAVSDAENTLVCFRWLREKHGAV